MAPSNGKESAAPLKRRTCGIVMPHQQLARIEMPSGLERLQRCAGVEGIFMEELF